MTRPHEAVRLVTGSLWQESAQALPACTALPLPVGSSSCCYAATRRARLACVCAAP